MKVSTYNLQASNGRHVRKATMVTFADGFTVRFTERMTVAEAKRQAEAYRQRDGGK